MRTSYLIPAAMAALLSLGGCGGEAPKAETPAAPSVPAPDLASLPAPYNEANLQAGASLWGKCRSCHTIEAGKQNLMGPNLHGLFERGTAALKNYQYSPAMQAFAHKAWTPELIDQWLSQPQAFLPGTAMTFNGFSKPEERRDVIAYLLINTRK